MHNLFLAFLDFVSRVTLRAAIATGGVLVVATWASAAPLVFDVCTGLLEIQQPLNTSYSGGVRCEGRLFPPTPDLQDECKPKSAVVTIDGIQQGLKITDLRQAGQGWGWDCVTDYRVKGCHHFTVAITVDTACSPLTPVISAASDFCIR